MPLNRSDLIPDFRSGGMEEMRQQRLRQALMERMNAERARLSRADQQASVPSAFRFGRPTGLEANDATGFSEMQNRQREIANIQRAMGGKPPLASKTVFPGNAQGGVGVQGSTAQPGLGNGSTNAVANQALATGMPIPGSAQSQRNINLSGSDDVEHQMRMKALMEQIMANQAAMQGGR